MGSRARLPFLPLIVTLLLLAPSVATAQSQNAPSPERLWSYDTGEATVNDVAINADGSAGAAVLSDASGQDQGDGEVCPWDLEADPRSSETEWPSCGDPNEGLLLAPEGMGVVATHKKPGSSDTFIAVGNEGTGGDSQSNIYVYSLNAGSGSDTQASYGSDGSPGGAVQDLIFLDGRTLLAWHTGSLSLLEHDQGTAFSEANDGRWSPGEETIQAVSIGETTGGETRILVATSQGTTDPTTRLYLLTEDNGALKEIGNVKSLQGKGAASAAAISDDGRFAVLGTDARWIYYYDIQPENLTDDNDKDLNFSASPYSTQGPDAVTAVDLTPDGERFAVGFADASVTVFRQTIVEDDGPRATTAGSHSTQANPTEIGFVQDGRQLYVAAGSLYGFHERQFTKEVPFEPVWIVPRASVVAFSDDGHRFLVGDQSSVRSFQQSYNATLAIDGPDQVKPGQAGTFSVEIANVGSAFDTYTLSTADLPTSWSASFNTTELRLLPGESANVTLEVTPDANQAPTNLTFSVEATSQADPDDGVAGSTTHDLTVPVVRGARLTVSETSVEASRGQVATIDAAITNIGNTNTTITLSVDQDKDWDIQIAGRSGSNADISLDPGENRSVPVEINVPDGAAEGASNDVTLTAQPAAGGTQDDVTVTVLVEPSYGGTLSVPTETLDVEPGEQRTFEVTVQNTGNTDDTYTLKTFSNASNPDHLWRASLSSSTVEVPGEGSKTVEITVNVPRGAETGERTGVTINARSQTTDEKVDEVTATLAVPEETDDSPLPLGALFAGVTLAALAYRRTR